ncbi:leucine-rich repeat receptor protein kinase EMS1-like [Prunus yedoensis var. nudiflora]|uniref:Leucine-rich repeat receptor protein kinase EMS1-like n=1 Tax=Prunus yedoensis var. nudiflora TaxID=2094558 RepID=A0A314XIN2_PRUYE|nr:leucine-rich repeat receptor protein kinase EMS1-like [Prunus yedoensis var. nudiflora]
MARSLNVTSIYWDINKEANPCLWKGVSCNPPSNSSVIQISLSGVSLSSSDFLPLVCQVESLQNLDVSGNRLRKIPSRFLSDSGKLDGLKLLNFSYNNLEGSLPDLLVLLGWSS